jgi:hypothetical protein
VSEDREAAVDLSLQELIYAGLDSLGALVPLDLCAYLHASGDDGPQLFLALPSLATMAPTQAFDLFTALRDGLDRPTAVPGSDQPAEQMLDVAGFGTLLVATAGRVSRGLHAVGRLDGTFSDGERARLARLAGTLGVATHRLEVAARVVQGTLPRPAAV